MISAEERFKEMINGMFVQVIWFPNVIWYSKNGNLLIYQDIKNGVCCIDYYKIWSVLKYEYGLNYQQVKELTTGILKQHLKHGVVTTQFAYCPIPAQLKQHLKHGVVTTATIQ